MNQPEIIAIASGKGGVGKSLITANLSISLAEVGKSVIAIDLDLGGSNLHSYLGIPNKYPGIGDYLIAHSGKLEELIIPTSISNLRFIPGDGRTPCMANLSFAEKIRLLLSIRWLKADYILLDLGSGSSFNTVDFFALAQHGILITAMDYPSIMNLMVFLRNFIFRAFDRELKNYNGLPKLLEEFRKIPMTDGQLSIPEMLERIKNFNLEAGKKAENICKRYKPRIIYNFCITPEQLNICDKLEKNCQNLLAIKINHFGFIFEDKHARQATYRSSPVLISYPQSGIAQCIRKTGKQIIQRWSDDTYVSSQTLIEEANNFLKK